MKNDQISRRDFGKASAAITVAASIPATSSWPKPTALNRNDSVRVGFVGVGNRGSQLMQAFAEHQDCQLVAVADAYQPYLDRAKKNYQDVDMAVEDYRRLLERKDIDAIVIATPDHWHAIQAITAMSAGKDVYVEKPLSATIHEGRQMVEAAKKFDRIAQVGLHRRSMEIYRQLAEFIQQGNVGKITVSRVPVKQHVPRRDRQAGILQSTRRLELGPLARPAPQAGLSGQHCSLQISLVAAIFVSNGQLGRALFRRHPLDVGGGSSQERSLYRRAIRGQRRSHNPRYRGSHF